MILVFSIYFFSLINYCFARSNKYGLAITKLCGTSFNIQEKNRYKFKIVLSGIKQIYFAPIKPIPFLCEDKDIIYDLTPQSETTRLNYIKEISVKKTELCFVAGSELASYETRLKKIVFLILSLPIQLSVLVLGIIKRDKSGINSILSNLLIASNLLKICKKSHTKNIILFCIYDTNSVFLTVCLQAINVFVSSVTSEVPLYKWNKIIVTDHLIICSEYQKIELETFKKTIKYKSYQLAEPEVYYEVKNLYTSDQQYSTNLGFLSTGGWVRNRLGHINQGIDIELNENTILKDLNDILKVNSHINLIIYPHPREVKYFDNNHHKLVEFYKSKLPDIDFEINTSQKPSNQLFNETYLSICYMSTIIFERLYSRRKAAIVYFKEDFFPLEFNSNFLSFIKDKKSLNNLIVKTYCRL